MYLIILETRSFLIALETLLKWQKDGEKVYVVTMISHELKYVTLLVLNSGIITSKTEVKAFSL